MRRFGRSTLISKKQQQSNLTCRINGPGARAPGSGGFMYYLISAAILIIIWLTALIMALTASY